jgi:hypothetical protein
VRTVGADLAAAVLVADTVDQEDVLADVVAGEAVAAEVLPAGVIITRTFALIFYTKKDTRGNYVEMPNSLSQITVT